MEIDFEIDRFFGKIASIRMDIQDIEKWCNTYEGFNYPKWTTKEGSQIALKDMTDEHLRNTISLVRRKDPTNTWLKALLQEKTYRELRIKLDSLISELENMEKISETIF